MGSTFLARRPPGSAKLAFRTRAGNLARPDRTWSDWSAPMLDPPGSEGDESERALYPMARGVWRRDGKLAAGERCHAGIPAAE